MQRVVLGHALDALLGDSIVAVALRQVRAEHHLHAAPLQVRTQLPLARHLQCTKPIWRVWYTGQYLAGQIYHTPQAAQPA